MPPVFHAAQAGPHMIASATHLRVGRKLSTTGFKIVDITDGLTLSPGAQCVGGDVEQVGLSQAGQTESSHQLELFLGMLQCTPYPLERISLGDSAGVAFINGGPQSGKLRLKLLFLPLQGPQRRADDLAGVFVTAALNLRKYEAVKIIRQIHIPSRHGGPLSFQSDAQRSRIGKV